MGNPNWSELNPDLLRCVFERLSFTSLNRVKLVCSWWYSVSKGCVPYQNQIPWLILVPYGENNNSRCALFVPEDEEKVYVSRDLGVGFARSRCLASYGSWLLLLRKKPYILNPLTGETIGLPDIQAVESELNYNNVCFWIDKISKDYLVVLTRAKLFTKKGYNNWQNLDCESEWCENVSYNEQNQELYFHVNVVDNNDRRVDIWDFSGDKPHKDRTVSLPYFRIKLNDFPVFPDFSNLLTHFRMVVTASGNFLMVSSVKRHRAWYFCIYKINEVDNKWEQIDSLGEEALIYNMGITVVANGNIPGIKRNSIYFSVEDSSWLRSIDLNNLFVYDLTTYQKEPFPQCVLSSIPSFTRARWFFPYVLE